MEMTTYSVSLLHQSQRDAHLSCRFTTPTRTRKVERIFYLDRDFSGYRQKCVNPSPSKTSLRVFTGGENRSFPAGSLLPQRGSADCDMTETLPLQQVQELPGLDQCSVRPSHTLFCVSSFGLSSSFTLNRLVGLVVRRPPRQRKIPGSNPAGGGIFSGSSHTSDLKIGTPVDTLPGAWCYRVSAGTGRPGVSIL